MTDITMELWQREAAKVGKRIAKDTARLDELRKLILGKQGSPTPVAELPPTLLRGSALGGILNGDANATHPLEAALPLPTSPLRAPFDEIRDMPNQLRRP